MNPKKETKSNIITFKAKPYKKVFEKQYDGQRWWRAYFVDETTDSKSIKRNNYGCVSIFGYIPDLDFSTDYTIMAQMEQKEPYGIEYRVLHIAKDLNNNYSANEVITFLECVIPSYASVLLEAYPDILDRIINDIPIDYSKTFGIKEKTYIKLKKKVLSNLKMIDYIIAFGDIMSPSVINNIYNSYPSAIEAKEAFSKNPYKFICDIPRVGFIKADKVIKKISNNRNNKYNIESGIESSKERCIACILYILEKEKDLGNSFIPVQELKISVSELCPECINKFIACLIDDRLYYNQKLMTVSLKEVYEIEKYIADTVLDIIKHPLSYDEIDTTKYRYVNDIRLTDEQIGFLDLVCRSSITILNGCAGTGKSFTINALIKMLNDNGLCYSLLAPTGKAAKVIREYTDNDAMTIHKWLISKKRSIMKQNYYVQDDVIIIDEFSMVDIYIFSDLLHCIDFKKTKLVLIGDSAQLLSVSTGNLLHEFIDTNVIPRVSLSEVFRYKDGGLMMVATDVRNGKNYFKPSKGVVTTYGDDYYFIETKKENIVNSVVGLYKRLIKDGINPYDIELLSAQKVGNYGTKIINKKIQEKINPYYGLEPCVYVENNDENYYIKDIVIQTVNNYHAKKVNSELNNQDEEDVFIANGEIGEIINIGSKYVYINFNDEIIKYSHEDMKSVQLGYAITVHKSQGSSAKAVIFISPESHSFMLSSNLIYVALTRTKNLCFHFGNEATIKRAIKKVENIKRKTLMHDLLLQII